METRKRTSLLKKQLGKIQKAVLLKCEQCGEKTKFKLKDVKFEIVQRSMIVDQNFVLIFTDEKGHTKELSYNFNKVSGSPWGESY